MQTSAISRQDQQHTKRRIIIGKTILSGARLPRDGYVLENKEENT